MCGERGHGAGRGGGGEEPYQILKTVMPNIAP